MNIWTILLIVLIFLAVGGGHWGRTGTGFYAPTYGYGVGGVLLVVLVLLLLGVI